MLEPANYYMREEVAAMRRQLSDASRDTQPLSLPGRLLAWALAAAFLFSLVAAVIAERSGTHLSEAGFHASSIESTEQARWQQ